MHSITNQILRSFLIHIPHLLAITLLWLYAIGWALIGYPIYRDQHIGAAIEYSTNGINFLHQLIPLFTSTKPVTLLKLPL